MIRELGKERTILLSTHILPEVSMICERVIIIHKGRIVAEDRIENLSAILKGGRRIRMRVEAPPADVTGRLEGIDGVRSVSYEEPYHVVEFGTEEEPRARITRAMVDAEWTLLSMESVEMSLEDIFLEVTRSEEGEN
jgi:ABC-2 type transport system ATP-binding protein